MEAGSRQVIVTFADEVLYEAVRKMVRHNIGRLPVVSRKNPRHIVGYLGRTNLMAGRLRYFEDEYVREGRFLRRPNAINSFAKKRLAATAVGSHRETIM